MDLGCGRGETLVVLREDLGPDAGLVAVDLKEPVLPEALVDDPKVETVVADLNQALPFADASFDAALCSDTLECLPRKQAFLVEVERILAPGGHLVLAHTDFDTLVFNSSDIELTRRLVHAFADTQEAWMDTSDGTIGRKLVSIARRSPFELVKALAWVAIDTDFQQWGRADVAVKGIRGALRRDDHHDLAAAMEKWIADLHALAQRGDFLFSVNDYAVLLRKRA